MLAKRLVGRGLTSTVGLAFVVGLSSCSGGPDLDQSDHARLQEAVQVSARTAGIDLTDSDRDCVIEKTSTSEAEEVLATFSNSADGLVLSDEVSSSMAGAVVDCVGSGVLVESGLLFFAGDISPESQACTGDTFDQDLLSQLIASFMSGTERKSTEIEIEIGLVLGQCLTPTELLRLHEG